MKAFQFYKLNFAQLLPDKGFSMNREDSLSIRISIFVAFNYSINTKSLKLSLMY